MSDVEVKICGITDSQSAQVAIDAGADYLGLILDFAQSPRFLKTGSAKALITALRQNNHTLPQLVGVFVDSSMQKIQEAAETLGLAVIQLHSTAMHAHASGLKQSNLSVWKVWQLASPPSLEEAKAIARDTDLILLDTNVQGRAGGGFGQTFSWQWTESLQGLSVDLGIAGGLTPDNVRDCIQQTRAALVDVSSGVESAPGIKSHNKIVRFVQQAKSQQPAFTKEE